MATSSRVGIVGKDGKTVRSIYIHWDGYPEGVGAMLKKHYKTTAKVNHLIKMGDISSLKSTLKATKKEVYSSNRGQTYGQTHNLKDYNDGNVSYNYLYNKGQWTITRGGDVITRNKYNTLAPKKATKKGK